MNKVILTGNLVPGPGTEIPGQRKGSLQLLLRLKIASTKTKPILSTVPHGTKLPR